MGAQLHYNICKEKGVQLDTKHWYEHVPKSVEMHLKKDEKKRIDVNQDGI